MKKETFALALVAISLLCLSLALFALCRRVGVLEQSQITHKQIVETVDSLLIEIYD